MDPVHHVIHAWRHRTVMATGAVGLFGEVLARVAAGAAGPLLCAPTHVGGWIAPADLLARLHEHVGEHELAAALFRLAPDGREDALLAARDLAGRGGALIRCALGGEPISDRRPAGIAARTIAGLDRVDNVVDRLLDASTWRPPEVYRLIPGDPDSLLGRVLPQKDFRAGYPSVPARCPPTANSPWLTASGRRGTATWKLGCWSSRTEGWSSISTRPPRHPAKAAAP